MNKKLTRGFSEIYRSLLLVIIKATGKFHKFEARMSNNFYRIPKKEHQQTTEKIKQKFESNLHGFLYSDRDPFQLMGDGSLEKFKKV